MSTEAKNSKISGIHKKVQSNATHLRMYGWFNTKNYIIIAILISHKKKNYMIPSIDGTIPKASSLKLEVRQRCCCHFVTSF